MLSSLSLFKNILHLFIYLLIFCVLCVWMWAYKCLSLSLCVKVIRQENSGIVLGVNSKYFYPSFQLACARLPPPPPRYSVLNPSLWDGSIHTEVTLPQYLIWKLHQCHTQKFVSQVIVDPVRLTTSIDHHITEPRSWKVEVSLLLVRFKIGSVHDGQASVLNPLTRTKELHSISLAPSCLF